MPIYNATKADASKVVSILRGQTDNVPLTFDEFIQTAFSDSSGNTDLKSTLTSIFVKIATHNPDGATEQSIESAIARALDYARWHGAWVVNTRYTTNQEVKNGSNYFRRLQSGISGSGDEPTQTSTTWLLLGGLDLEIAKFHEAVVSIEAKNTAQDQAIALAQNDVNGLELEIAGLEADIQNQIRAFASHQEIVVHELPDPTAALSPEYAYLSNLWKPEQGFAGNQAPIPYSPGEYWNTAGTANRAKFRFSSTTVDIDGTERTMRGFFQRAQRLQHHGLPIVSFGEALNNPVGGAVPGLYFGRDPGNPLGLAQSWQCWIKTVLARASAKPWNLPRSPESSQLIARVYHGSNHFDIPLSRTITRTVDGVEYTQLNCGSNPQPGAAWINALDLTDEAASTIEVEFRTSNGSTVLWLGDMTRAWTWVDPEDNPTAVARIDKIQRATMWQGALLASMTRSGAGNLDEAQWTVEAGLTGVAADNSGANTDGAWSKYLNLDCDEFGQGLNGSHGIVVVVERAGAIVSSVFLPWSTFAAPWDTQLEVFAGKWDTGGTGSNKVVFASTGVTGNNLHIRLSCTAADGDSTVRIYRNN